MAIEFLLQKFRENWTDQAMIWHNRGFSYHWLLMAIAEWRGKLERQGLARGAVVSLEADFSPNAVALLLALIKRGCIIVPLTGSVEMKKGEFREIAEVETIIEIDPADQVRFKPCAPPARHPRLRQLREAGHPGRVLFSSGSTGKSKAALHDFVPLRIPKVS